eukprot:scaffold138092_cov34-Tisochrysis_lutea.AAC.1
MAVCKVKYDLFLQQHCISPSALNVLPCKVHEREKREHAEGDMSICQDPPLKRVARIQPLSFRQGPFPIDADVHQKKGPVLLKQKKHETSGGNDQRQGCDEVIEEAMPKYHAPPAWPTQA